MAVLTFLASFLPLGVGVARYKKLNLAMRAFAAFCCVICVELVVEFVLAFHHINNNFVSNAGLGIEALCLAAVYTLSVDMKSVRRVIIASAVVFVCVWVPDKMFFEDPKQINEAMCIFSSTYVIVISVIALHTVARTTTNPLSDEPIFWITSANILLSSGDIFVLGTSNELLAMGVSYFTAAWYINWSLDIIAYILFTKALLCKAAQHE